MSSQWLHASASVTGSSHHSSNTPCQDASHTSISADGQWLAIAVCDGAGSALHSKAGADLVAKSFSVKLLELSAQVKSRTPGAWINDFVIQQILDVRSEIRKLAGSDEIGDYHSTLVACLLGPDGGFSIHIGDGALFGGSGSGISKDGHIYLDNNFFISKPENGEYANETFFITEGSWVKHLRIIPLPPADWVIIGSDGGCALCLDSGDQPKPEFVAPLITHLSEHSSSEWAALLQHTLSDSKADLLTNDDKTLVVCVRDSLLQNKATAYRYTDQESNSSKPSPTNIPASAKPATPPTTIPAFSSASGLKAEAETTQPDKNSCCPRRYTLIAILSALVIALIALCLWEFKPGIASKLFSTVGGLATPEKSPTSSEEQNPAPQPPSQKQNERHRTDEKALTKPASPAASATQI